MTMRHEGWIPRLLIVACLLLAAGADRSKRRVEAPVKNLLDRTASSTDAAGDVANRSATPDSSEAIRAALRSPTDENPKVAPGSVRWHESFAAATEAGRKSGKPVLLFQMMGNLDDRFC